MQAIAVLLEAPEPGARDGCYASSCEQRQGRWISGETDETVPALWFQVPAARLR